MVSQQSASPQDKRKYETVQKRKPAEVTKSKSKKSTLCPNVNVCSHWHLVGLLTISEACG